MVQVETGKTYQNLLESSDGAVCWVNNRKHESGKWVCLDSMAKNRRITTGGLGVNERCWGFVGATKFHKENLWDLLKALAQIRSEGQIRGIDFGVARFEGRRQRPEIPGSVAIFITFPPHLIPERIPGELWMVTQRVASLTNWEQLSPRLCI